jgi:4-hydroxyphenylacetate 3-monooxygenase
MRTGAEYREALRDGRKVWVMGEGWVEDVTTHPATRAMVDEYVAWYDRHVDPAWRDVVLTPPDPAGARAPWSYVAPRSPSDLSAMGRCFSATTFLSAGNITHTPAYGNLIALGILDAIHQRHRLMEGAEGPAGPPPSSGAGKPESRHDALTPSRQVAQAADYRALIARTGRFLTFCAGAATIGARLRPDPGERVPLRAVRETDAGIVLRGKVGMHTSPAYAEDVYIGALSGVDVGPHRATFVVPVAAPGVTVLCRKISARHPNPFITPLSSRYDELDGQMWLDDVFIPWERVFLMDLSPEVMASWLFWHQLYCWLSKAEFTLGLALACAHSLGLKDHEATIDYLVDLVIDVQTVRSCQTAAELDPDVTAEGYCIPGRGHIAAGSIAMLKARQRITETLRILPGSSLMVAPSDTDLASPDIAAGLEESFSGGGYTARQRAALLQMASDHVASALDGRESAFELHANGGIPAWRGRLRRAFGGYNELANAVLRTLSVDMPEIDLDSLRAIPMPVRRPVTPPPSAPTG